MKTFECVAKLAPQAAETRAVDFILSTAEKDRVGDCIDPKGWRLDPYLKNPVVLWQHNRDLPPIAKATNVRVEGGSLKATATFATAEQNPLADTVYRLLQGGFLNAVSVGFRPLKYAFREGDDFGIDFQEQELLEFSVVNVPCHQGALAEARSKGIDLSPLAKSRVPQIAPPPAPPLPISASPLGFASGIRRHADISAAALTLELM